MLKTRVLTVLLLLPVILGILFLAPAAAWNLFVLLGLACAAWEWGRLAGLQKIESTVFIATFLALGLAWLYLPIARLWAVSLDVFSLLFWGVLAPSWLHFKRPLAPKWLAALLGWLLLLAALAAMSRLREWPLTTVAGSGATALLAIMAIAWVADIAAYFVGRAFGRRKLAPSISPGKSWEGVYGALIAVAAYLLLLRHFDAPIIHSIPLYVLLPLGALITGVSIVGDLFESLLKRQAGLKDSSQLLPGHGGVLDRIDSLIAMIPVLTALLFFYARFNAAT